MLEQPFIFKECLIFFNFFFYDLLVTDYYFDYSERIVWKTVSSSFGDIG